MGVDRKHTLHEMVGIDCNRPSVYVAIEPESVHVCLLEGSCSRCGDKWGGGDFRATKHTVE